MLNKAPIFVHGFARGGTNMIMNLIASHPNIGMLGGELHQVFYGKEKEGIKKWVSRFLYFPIFAAARQHIFWHRCLDQRNRIPRFMMYYIDLLLHLNKSRAAKNQFKFQAVKYSPSEAKNLRLLSKNPNGLAFTTGLFSKMYPDAVFIALVRNGFAVCEGMIRRGWEVGKASVMYEKVCQRMISYSKSLPNYHILRFEHMISDPVSFIRQVYSYAKLDLGLVPNFRIQAKKSMDKNGSRRYMFGQKDRELHWVHIEQLNNYFRKDVDKNQLLALSPSHKEIFLSHARKSMEYFCYL